MIGKLNKQVQRRIEEQRNRTIDGVCPYGYLDGITFTGG